MRRTAGWLLTAVGVLAAVLGVALAAYLGPDGRRTTGPHAVDTSGSVVVTAPRMIRWVDVQVDVLAEVPVSKPVFVGLGNTVDVESLVADTARLEITDFATPWKPSFEQVDGEKPTVSGAPTALDWWVADSAGLGGASISATLPDEPVSLAIVSVGDSNLQGLEVTFAYGIKGGFGKAVGLILLGAAALLVGRQVRRGEHFLVDGSGAAPEATEEEVVYVYVDDDGVEHELSADDVEAGEFAVVEDEAVEPEPEPTTEPEPEPEPTTEPEPEPTLVPEPPAPASSEAVYVWVDDDGVEHELTEAELAELGDEYEIVDEEDDR